MPRHIVQYASGSYGFFDTDTSTEVHRITVQGGVEWAVYRIETAEVNAYVILKGEVAELIDENEAIRWCMQTGMNHDDLIMKFSLEDVAEE